MIEKTLSEFIIEEQRLSPGATGAFTSLLNGIRLSCKRVAWLIGKGTRDADGTDSHPGAAQIALDLAANEIFLRTLESRGSLAGMSSNLMSEPYGIPKTYPVGRYLLAFDALEGASNLDVNVSAGSFFSVLRAPEAISSPTAADFLQPGTQQVGAGYAIYGPSMMLVLTVGRGVHGFTLNRGFGEFILTHPNLKVQESTREFAVNSSNARFWEPALQRYVQELVQGKSGPRGEDFTMRWMASLAAEVHRILIRGGVLMVPTETREAAREGSLQLLYQANAIAMLIEQAGGAASTGRSRILEVKPRALDQRVPVILGAREEVLRIEKYHRAQDEGLDEEFTSPLFNERSLFPTVPERR